jgi:NHL repeat
MGRLRRAGVADAETSALREVRQALVSTAIGQGLFDFGHRDGPADEALLQHPLGVAVLPDGSVAIADTYNGAVRRYDPATRAVTTLADGLAEPSDVLGDGDTLVAVESAAHRLVRLPIPAAVRAVAGGAQRVRRTPTDVAPGHLTVRVAFVPPTGQHLDTRFGDPAELTVAASPPER